MRIWPVRAAHIGFALIAVAVLIYILAYETTHQATYNTIQLSLFVVTFSLLSYSPRWWIALVALSVLSWVLILKPLGSVRKRHLVANLRYR